LGNARYTIIIRPTADKELQALKTFDLRKVVDAIEGNLTHEPQVESRNRKPLEDQTLEVSFEFSPPLWELRIGEIRVFYDVNEGERKVIVRAVIRKPPGKTTQEILR
jgi:mRNA-degrading endonuclease RelE of RelBE toxin-antitoxin system